MGDLAHDPRNEDHEALKGFVDRMFALEQNFADVKAEYSDEKKELKAEIKSRADETGVTVDRVVGLVKIRLDEAEAMDHQAETNANMELYEQVYGFSAPAEPAEDEEDPLG